MRPLDAALAALDGIDAQDDSGRLIIAKSRALLKGYAARWHDDLGDFIPLEVEQVKYAPMVNQSTGARSRKLTVAGKIDHKYRRRSNSIVGIMDHKTTSDDVGDPAGAFWRVLQVDSQAPHYMLLEWMNGEKINEATWDVIRKPTINPKQLTSKAEVARVVADRKYCNAIMSDETLFSLQTSNRETLEMYEARLAQDCIETRPEWYFQRRPVPRLDSEINEYRVALWESGQMVLESRRLGRWPKHPGSCMAYGTPCKYLGICSGYSQPDGPEWQVRETVHSELTLEQDRNTLTHSSIRCYQQCPRKFYYLYQLGIERVQDEESVALRFGTIIHSALEAYWLALMPEENDNGTSADSVNSAECEPAATTCPF